MAFTEDLSAFINSDTPGYVLATVSGAATDALFDNDFLSALGIASSGPVLTVVQTDIAGVIPGAAVVVGAVNYTVAEVQPDGLGLTRLTLEAV